MLKWIGKVLGGTGAAPAEATTSVWLQRLQTYLAPLDQLPEDGGRPGLAEAILTYVRQGDGPQVLAELGQRYAVANYLNVLRGHACRVGSLGPRLYHDMTDVDPAQLLRWARVLEACPAHRFGIAMDDGCHWPELLLTHSVELFRDPQTDETRIIQRISAPLMEALLLEAHLPPSALLTACFSGSNDAYRPGYGIYLVPYMDGYSQWVLRHVEALRPLLLAGDMYLKFQVMNLMTDLDPPVMTRMAGELCEMACGGNKEVREQAAPLLLHCQRGALQPLSQMIQAGKPDQRGHALRLLWALANQLEDGALRAEARALAEADRAASVRGLLAEWAAEPAAEQGPVQYSGAVIDWAVPMTPERVEVLDQLWADLNEPIEQYNQHKIESNATSAQGKSADELDLWPVYSAEALSQLKAFLASSQAVPPAGRSLPDPSEYFSRSALEAFADSDDLSAAMAFKVLDFCHFLSNDEGRLKNIACSAFDRVHEQDPSLSLMALAQRLEDSGRSGDVLLLECFNGALAQAWDAEAVAPYFALHVAWLEQALIDLEVYSTDSLYRGIVKMTPPPPQLVSRLFEIALGSNQGERVQAQRALERLPDKEAHLIAALGSGKSEVKLLATQWLGNLGHKPAIPALEQALKKDKNDGVRTAMIEALEQLGQPVEQYLDRQQWVTDASKAMAKGAPKDLAWFPWDALPELCWADTQEPVPALAAQGLLAQAVKLKSAQPGALLRRFCGMFEPRSRERFGQFVLDAWLAEDTRPIPLEEAQQLAERHASNTLFFIQRYPDDYKDSPHLGKSLEELTASFLPRFIRQPQGSAAASKGLLAVVAACAGAEAAAPAGRYLKEFYGTRASQGKALIAMLAWVEHPSATQLLLSIASRFRTAGFQEEAILQARALAERKNWTLAELADRTLPSAGFDENGLLELSYGERVFSARLLADFKIELYNPDGKKIAALPDPRQDDDADEAKEAKKQFANAKKSLASLVKQQTERLYEALCTGREWPYADWQRYLNQHPIMRRLLQRLVWVQVEDEQVLASFRPLDDGSLTDVEDNPLTLADEARVRLAHDSLLSAEALAQWQQHLVDYEVAPLFQQLGKGVYQLPEGQGDAHSIEDFKGHLLETFALRSRALKLGYTRGATEDAGWFYTYEKFFVSLGLSADIRFTGNPLPESNRTVALVDLTFYSEGYSLPLAEVPTILLSECYNDLRLIAAQGTGFDPDWEKKSEY